MADTNTFARSLHDLGAAAWFGSTLMGATAVNRAASDIDDPVQRSRAINGVWRRWWPVNLAGVVAHAAGGAVLSSANARRIAGQPGVATLTASKTAVTVAAIGTSAYAGLLGKRINDAGDVPMGDGTTPVDATPEPVARAQRHQAALQWVLPLLSGALIVLGAALGETQRPTAIAGGVLERLDPRR